VVSASFGFPHYQIYPGATTPIYIWHGVCVTENLTWSFRGEIMLTRKFTYVTCPCGHRGAIVESENAEQRSGDWYMASLRDLEHKGTYDGPDDLFGEMSPSCPKCGASLTPSHISSQTLRGFASRGERAKSRAVAVGSRLWKDGTLAL
jgi:hypothetical protein